MTYRMLMGNISTHQQALYKLQQQITSGKKVSMPSDDPGTFEIIGRLHDDAAGITQFTKNAQRAESDLLVVDNNLQSVVKLFQRASELASQGSDGTTSPDDKAAMSKEVNQLLEALIDIANSSDKGRYIFSGLNTDTKPFVAARDAAGLATSVGYAGSLEVKQVEIGKGVYVEDNIPGADPAGANAVFQTSTVDLFDQLINLRDALAAGQNPADTTIMADLENGIEHAINMLATVGARGEKIKLCTDVLSRREQDIATALENEESLDVAEAATRLSKVQAAYEAALGVAGRMLNQPTLMDYL